MLISITGRLGSGKSTVCGIMKERYGFEIFSTGAIQREFARSKGISTLELNKRMKENPELDDEIDNTVTRMSREHKGENLIFDSRMAWHCAEDTFKIFLTIDPMEAATRVFYHRSSAEENYTDVNDACDKLVERSAVERKRFIEIYGVDYYDFNNYNLVVDTTSKTPDEVVSVIMEYYKLYSENPETYGGVKEL